MGCGPGRHHWLGDPDLFGVALVVTEDAAPFAQAADACEHLRRTLLATSVYFGFDPADLAGLRIVLQGPPVQCSGFAGPLLGCYEWESNTVTVSTRGVHCLEASPVSHEVLHYFIGDPGHTDPRWTTFVPLWLSLQGASCN